MPRRLAKDTPACSIDAIGARVKSVLSCSVVFMTWPELSAKRVAVKRETRNGRN
jgi:hypothetical protein